MDLIFVPETGKNAADIVFTYAKKQERKAGGFDWKLQEKR